MEEINSAWFREQILFLTLKRVPQREFQPRKKFCLGWIIFQPGLNKHKIKCNQISARAEMWTWKCAILKLIVISALQIQLHWDWKSSQLGRDFFPGRNLLCNQDLRQWHADTFHIEHMHSVLWDASHNKAMVAMLVYLTSKQIRVRQYGRMRSDVQCVVLEKIHTHPMERHWKFLGGGGGLKG